MERRTFLTSISMSLAGAALTPPATSTALPARIQTVMGSIEPQQLGLTLMHEHVMVDFIGAEKVSRSRYDAAEVYQKALPHLQKIRSLGCRSFVDCTPNWLGRDVTILQRLSKASGVRIITNTGYYGARNHLFLPALVAKETPEQLSARWVREFEEGIDGTGIKPGFIKIGVDAGPLSELNQKIVAAAALTHLQTGLTIGAHTGDGRAAIEELDLIRKHGVSPEAFIWIHAHSEKDPAIHLEAARRGCWIEFDGVHPKSVDRHIELVKSLRDAGKFDRALISQDAGWYHIGEPGGGDYRGYDAIFTQFLPALRKNGFSEAQIGQLFSLNPQRALSIQVRRGV